MRRPSDRGSSKVQDSGDRQHVTYNHDETGEEGYLEDGIIYQVKDLLLGTFWVSMVMVLWMFSVYAIHIFFNPLNMSGGLFSVSVLGIASVFTFRSAMTLTQNGPV